MHQQWAGARPSMLILHDRAEGLGIERRSTDQRAVDAFGGHQRVGVVGLYGAAVEDAELAGELLAEGLRNFAADDGVGVGGDFGRRGFSGADGPDGLVGNDEMGSLLGGNRSEEHTSELQSLRHL